jgi:hypothetical protein
MTTKSDALYGRTRMKRLVVVPIVLFASLFAVSTAKAVIVPQRSIAGVELEMTKAQVRSVLGDPRRVVHGTNEFGRYTVFRYRRLSVTFQGGANVTHVQTNRLRERTVRGAGVGSTRGELRARVVGIRCRPRFCFKGRFLPGRRVTVFRFCDGIVTRVEVGFVID